MTDRNPLAVDLPAVSDSGAARDAQCIVYVMDVAERPGIAHAISAVFAHRGLSMWALIADAHRRPPRVLAVFEGTQRQQKLVGQVLARLHDVQRVRALPADSPELRAIAICHARAGLPAMTDVSLQSLGDAWLLSGSYAAVDRALARWQAEGLIDAVSRSLVAA